MDTGAEEGERERETADDTGCTRKQGELTLLHQRHSQQHEHHLRSHGQPAARGTAEGVNNHTGADRQSTQRDGKGDGDLVSKRSTVSHQSNCTEKELMLVNARFRARHEVWSDFHRSVGPAAVVTLYFRIGTD